MSFLSATRSVERQRFFNGQRLFADDLQRIEAFNREMRWLHNQSLHQPGIGNGFAVTGKKGDREVIVAPGYAIDDLGREIVLTSSRTIPVPPVAGGDDGKPQRYFLTVQYPDDEDLEEVERREGICDTNGAVRLREEPIFCWVPINPDGTPARDQADILTGRKLILAEIAVRDCKLDKDLSIVQRRNARPPAQPYIACGAEDPTAWEDWDFLEDGENGPTIAALGSQLSNLYQIVGGVQAKIDTTQGGFLTTPGYFARIDGPRVIEIPNGEESFKVVLDGLLNIVDPTATGFTAQVLVLLFAADDRPDPILIARLARQPEVDRGHFVEGMDVSALTFAITHPVSLEAPESDPAIDEAAVAADEGEPTLPEVLKGWSVGWMGVEG